MENPFYKFYHKGTKQNAAHFHTHCKACVMHHLESIRASVSDLMQGNQAFKDACQAVGSTRSDKPTWIAHLIGGRGVPECPYSSEEAKAYATIRREETKSNKRSRTESTPGPSEVPPPAKKQQLPSKKQQIQSMLTNLVFEDPEMQILFGMLRTTAPNIIPTAKVAGGRLLNAAAAEVELKIGEVVWDKKLGLATDGWKLKKECQRSLRQCGVPRPDHFPYKSYLLELIEVTALSKDGPSLCEQFVEMIDRIEEKYGCIVIYFTTDADGGSKKGRILLGKKTAVVDFAVVLGASVPADPRDYCKVNDIAAIIAEDATALIGWLNNHGKVRKIFDESQATVSQDRNAARSLFLLTWSLISPAGPPILSLFRVSLPSASASACCPPEKTAIIAAEVGAAVSTETERLSSDANKFCTLIEDTTFWSGLEMVLGDLEPICLGTNINQKDSTCLDQVLLTIAGIFLRFVDHPEPEPAFLLTLILNPFEKLSCFGPNTNLNQFKCRNLLIPLYRRMNSRPNNEDTAQQRTAKENQVSKAIMQYLSGTGDFTDFIPDEWRNIHENEDPIAVWEAWMDSQHLSELAHFAIMLLHIVANQAGCKRTFSLGLEKTDKRMKVKAQIRSEHQQQGLSKPRAGHKNDKSLETLLSVPRYRDLLEDQGDEDHSNDAREAEHANNVGDAEEGNDALTDDAEAEKWGRAWMGNIAQPRKEIVNKRLIASRKTRKTKLHNKEKKSKKEMNSPEAEKSSGEAQMKEIVQADSR
ncbi:hypothetical protein B0H10DRAFT_1940380 [Mycena sp. CBHHK59/15]|nr:hypothetical protein B0H10DRAFT_1940380 [Mycena sp. CBHHK59/15]